MFITLVNSTNLHEGRHIKSSERIRVASRCFVGMVRNILDRGVKSGDFRDGVDPVQLNISIAAIGYYDLTKRFTGSMLFERDFTHSDVLRSRLDFNIDTIMRLVAA